MQKSSAVRAVASIAALATAISLAACDNPAPSSPPPDAGLAPAGATRPDTSQELAVLKSENARLQNEIRALSAKVEELSQTPQLLLDKVQALIRAGSLTDAETVTNVLETRFGASSQLKTARADLAQAKARVAAQAAQTQLLEAKGFYALKPTAAAKVGEFIIKVESVSLGNRWMSDAHGDQYLYRDARRGQKFVLLRTALQSTDKSLDPDLPDIGVYQVQGKMMTRVAGFSYEFRRWSSYGTYIGLYHDFKNDFSHSSTVLFNAGASLDEEDAKKPFAVVATGLFCHERKKRIGQPELEYTARYECRAKDTLSTEDFSSGDYQVLSFFNKPKGV